MNEGLAVHEEHGIVTYVNNRFCQIVGYLRDEIVGHPVLEFLEEANRTMFQNQMAIRRKHEQDPYEIVLRRKDDQPVTVIMSPVAMFGSSGEFKGSSVVVTDITDRKRMEEALRSSESRLRLLSFQLMKAQETERARVSRELHDELGGTLAVLKLRLKVIQKGLQPDQERLRKECEDYLVYIDQVMDNVHRLSRDLSPVILQDLGLSTALRRLMTNLTKDHGVKVTADVDDVDDLLPKDAQLTIYRIFQEAMNNIGKHAEARNVSISIRRDDGRIAFLLEDDGKGFDLTNVYLKNAAERGLGLAAIDERVRMLNGVLSLSSEEGKGTRVSFEIPLKREGCSSECVSDRNG
jgi:PAS domain S-box-containing protein